MGNLFISETEPKRETVTRYQTTKSHNCLTCLLCNKTLDISNSDHYCEIRQCVDKFSIKFT
jgi:Fe2+ or Zn2+ uptake regulation protein